MTQVQPSASPLDRGYDALGAGQWEQAAQIFQPLLEKEETKEMACLGLFMARRQISSRQELSWNWEALQKDPEFAEALAPLSPTFLHWLQTQMDAEASLSAEDTSGFTWVFPSFSELDRDQQVLLIFSGIQVLLFLAVTFCYSRTDPEEPGLLLSLLGGLIQAVVFSGLPVILGPVYGNSILHEGRFRILWKILNSLVAISGGFLFGILSVACFLSMTGPEAAPQDPWFFAAYLLSFLLYLSSLVFPIILRRLEEE